MLTIARFVRLVSGWLFFIATLGGIPIVLTYFAPGIYEWITNRDFKFKSEKSRRRYNRLETVVYILAIILIGSFVTFCISGFFNMILYVVSLS